MQHPSEVSLNQFTSMNGSLFAPPNYPGSMHDHAQNYTTTSSITPTNGPRTQTTSPIVQSTSVLAIKYNGGVLVAADTLASYGSLARYRDIRRLKPVGKYTLIGASGELSDFQFLSDHLDEIMTDEYVMDDGAKLYPKEIYNYLTRVMYGRRSKMDPLWNQLVVAGYRDGKSFLGLVDLLGTSYEDNTIATGYGAYIALPLLRNVYRPNLTEEEAKKALDDCLRVMFYRDARALDRVQVASVSKDGILVSEPYALKTDWEFGRNVT